jgi:predicted DNA binding protein
LTVTLPENTDEVFSPYWNQRCFERYFSTLSAAVWFLINVKHLILSGGLELKCAFMTDEWSKPYHVVLQIENRQCAIVKRLAPLGLKHLKVADIRSSSTKSVKHLIELDPAELAQIKRLPSELKTLVKDEKTTAKSSVWLDSSGCGVCSTILSSDAFLVSGKSLEDYTITYSFLVPRFEAFQQIMQALEKQRLKVKVLKMGKFEAKNGVLTEKQERIFWVALKGGFFDYPRKIDTSKLAAKLGISPSTLSEITRRGMRRLLESYFKNEAPNSSELGKQKQ